MADPSSGRRREIETWVVGLYDLLYEEDVSPEEFEVYELTGDHEEGEVYLPYIGINFDLWEEWSTEKHVVVESIHEYVIEPEIDTVADRRSAVRDALDLAPECPCD